MSDRISRGLNVRIDDKWLKHRWTKLQSKL